MHTIIVEATLSFIEHHRHSAALVVFLLAFCGSFAFLSQQQAFVVV